MFLVRRPPKCLPPRCGGAGCVCGVAPCYAVWHVFVAPCWVVGRVFDVHLVFYTAVYCRPTVPKEDRIECTQGAGELIYIPESW